MSDFSYQELTPKIKDLLNSFFDNYHQTLNTSWQDSTLIKIMEESNPVFIPRNYLLHQAYLDLREGKQQLFDDIFLACKNPYQQPKDQKLAQKAPDWAFKTPGCSLLSCSS